MKSTKPLMVLGERTPAGAAVLVIDDQYLVSSALAIALRDMGLNAHSLQVTDLAAVQNAALAYAPGLVLLDLDRGSGPDAQPIDSVDPIGPLRAQGWTVMVITGMTSLDRIADAVARLLKQSPMAPRTGSSMASPLPNSSTPRPRSCTDAASLSPSSALT